MDDGVFFFSSYFQSVSCMYSDKVVLSMIQNDVLDGAKLEGRMEGRMEGKMEERLEIANNLKSLGVDITAIHKATGLSPEEIEKL